jgi:geranylgeranyl reductase family protein
MQPEIEHVDVLIVGSGPAGASTALHLVHQDPTWAGRILVIDKAIHPREKLCGGGLTHLGQNILTRLGLPLEPASFPVHEVRLVYQDKSYSFFGNPVFRILRRDEFDHWLVQTAEKQGVTIRQGETLKELTPHPDYVEVTTDRAIIHAKVLVAADGSRSPIRQKLKWDDSSRVARLLEVLTPEDPQHQPEFKDGVAIFDFTRMTGGLQGYYWDFPSYVKGKPFMNRGVFDSRARPERPKTDLKEDLRESMAERNRNLDDYKLKGHPIRWFDKNGRFAAPRIILAGDSAGADPLMGEGISFALGYGVVAAGAIADAFTRQDFSFATYRRRILDDPLLSQLPVRVSLARLAYLLRWPWFVRLGWQAARLIIRFTRWRDPNYTPAEPLQSISSINYQISSKTT